jgi:glycosyltransferase involved in cell wall biosynthesis
MMSHSSDRYPERLTIALLEPYDTGSHAAWVRGYAAHSGHHIVPLTLKGQFWKWRMHGGAVTLARLYREQGLSADLILATDMLDLSTFLALTRDLTWDTPTALYMHENQLTYPAQPGQKRDLHYGFINYASMLCADRIFFNSAFHLDSWFDELPRLLKHFPDCNELHTVAELRVRSEVLALGLSLAELDTASASAGAHASRAPLILWNHRWEYDKDPAAFFRALETLARRGVDFRVAVLGESFVRVPPEFEAARERLGHRIVQFGYLDDARDYVEWLWQADITVSTAIHDFFGAAVVEAIYCRTFPILPNRLAYPQFVPEALHPHCIYNDEAGLVNLLEAAVRRAAGRRRHILGDEADADGSSTLDIWTQMLRRQVSGYDWSRMAAEYDRRLTELYLANPNGRGKESAHA